MAFSESEKQMVNHIAQQVRYYRRRKGLVLDDFDKRGAYSVPRMTVSRLERPTYQSFPNLYTLLRVARILDVHIHDLIGPY